MNENTLKMIQEAFKDKEFKAKLLTDSIPEYTGMKVEFVMENYILDEEPEIVILGDKVSVNFKALSPNDPSEYIGFTVNFVL